MIWMKKWRKRRNENMCVVCIHHTVRDIICIFFININYINIKIKKNENKNYFIMVENISAPSFREISQIVWVFLVMGDSPYF